MLIEYLQHFLPTEIKTVIKRDRELRYAGCMHSLIELDHLGQRHYFKYFTQGMQVSPETLYRTTVVKFTVVGVGVSDVVIVNDIYAFQSEAFYQGLEWQASTQGSESGLY